MTKLAVDISLRLHAFMLNSGTISELFSGGVLQGTGTLTATTILGQP